MTESHWDKFVFLGYLARLHGQISPKTSSTIILAKVGIHFELKNVEQIK